MRVANATAADARTAPAVGAGKARLAVLFLAVLMIAAALLRVWYLPAPERSRAETAAIQNIEASLAGSEVRDYRVSPLAWYPQLVVLRLADRLHDGTGFAPLQVVTAKGRLTRRGLHLARHLSVLYGMAGVAFLFLLARRLHSTAVALLAALILCFSPWHIQASATLDPEALVVCLSAGALWLGLRALDAPSAVRLGLVGVVLGAAAAAKVTGAPIAVPVLLGLILGGRRGWRGRLWPLAICVPAAIAVWWALTPPLGSYASALELEQASQVGKAVTEVSSRFTVAVFGLLYPMFDSVHGRLLGALALLGAVGQAFRCLFLIDPGPARAHRLMVLAGAPVFVLGYAWVTPLFRESSFVPLLVYSSLYAAVMLGILWSGLGALAPRFGSRRAAVVASVVVLALVVPPGWRYVYSSVVQSTLSASLDWLRQGLQGGGPRLVLVEEAALKGGPESAMQLARGLGLSLVPRLADLDEERLARADAEVFLRRQLAGEEGDFYRGRRDGGARRKAVAARLLRRAGPDLVAVLHPYGSGPPEESSLRVYSDGTQRVASVPASADDGAAVTVVLRLATTRERAPAAPRAWLDGVEIDLAAGGFFSRNTIFVSERLPAATTPRRLQIETPPWMSPSREGITIASYVWR